MNLEKKGYANPDPARKTCDFQAAVFTFINVLVIESELVELDLVASASELLSATEPV